MTKIVVIPNKLEMIDQLIDKVDGFIIGCTDLSVNLPFTVDMNDLGIIIERVKRYNKDIFISLNKNMHNSDLDKLRDVLLYLNDFNIDGVIYYDISIVQLKSELKLNYDLVWGQEHLTTNYFTINYWNHFGAKYTLLSSDITLDEIKEINNNTNSKLLVTMFGYLPMFTSYRHLATNYLKTFNIETSNKNYYIEKEGKSYSIVDNNLGTIVYSNNILNGIDEYLELKNNNIDYVVLNSYNIDNYKFEKVVDLFNKVDESNVTDCSSEINNMFSNVDKGFLYKETVYKVKSNE